MIDAHITDFSDRIDRLDHSYETYEIKETIPNKLSRIRKELEELEDEIDKNGGGGDGDDEEELNKLQEIFEKLNKKTGYKKINILKKLSANGVDGDDGDDGDDNADGDDSIISIPKTSIDAYKFIEIDERINKLEKTIGDFQINESFQFKINEIFKKFKLLSNDKELLSQIRDIIDLVNLKFEKSITTRRFQNNVQNDVDEDIKINEIYINFTKMIEFEQDLPFLMKRLESLNEIHLKLGNSVNFIDDMEENLNKMEIDLKQWENSLNELQDKFESLSTNFETINK